MSCRVDFHLLANTSTTEHYKYICRLAEKIYSKKHQLYIYVNSKDEAQQLDDMLWTFRDVSFVPHGNAAPIQIGYAKPPEAMHDVLLNVTTEIPAFYSNFNRVLEIIPDDPALKNAGRKKYKSYQEQGCELKVHKIV